MAQVGNPFRFVVTASPEHDPPFPPHASINAEAWGKIERALDILRARGQERKIVYLIGSPGSGKTTLLQRLRLEALPRGYHFAYVEPLPSRTHLYAQIAGRVVASLDRRKKKERGLSSWSALDDTADVEPTPLSRIGLRCLSSALSYLARRPGKWHLCFRDDESVIEAEALLDANRCPPAMLREESCRLNREYVCGTGLAAVSRRLEGVSGHVVSMLTSLCFDETEAAARKWLLGEGLGERDLSVLGLPEDLRGDLVGRTVLRSISLLLDRPIVLAIDELEVSRKNLGKDGTETLINVLRDISNNMGQEILLVLTSQMGITEDLLGFDEAFQDRLLDGGPIPLRGLGQVQARALSGSLAPRFQLSDSDIEEGLTRHHTPRAFLSYLAGLWDSRPPDVPEGQAGPAGEEAEVEPPPAPDIRELLRRQLDGFMAAASSLSAADREAAFRGLLRVLFVELEAPLDRCVAEPGWCPADLKGDQEISADLRLDYFLDDRHEEAAIQVALIGRRMHHEVERIDPITGQFGTILFLIREEQEPLPGAYEAVRDQLKKRWSGLYSEIRVSKDDERNWVAYYRLWEALEAGRLEVEESDRPSTREHVKRLLEEELRSRPDSLRDRILAALRPLRPKEADKTRKKEQPEDHAAPPPPSPPATPEPAEILLTEKFLSEARSKGGLKLTRDGQQLLPGGLAKTVDPHSNRVYFHTPREQIRPLAWFSKGELRRMGVRDMDLDRMAKVETMADLAGIDLPAHARQRLEIKVLEHEARKRAVSYDHVEDLVGGIVQDMLMLDQKQWALVQANGEMPLLVRGVAGSGKTQILLHAACRYAYESPPKKVLLLTYNRALATLARTLVHRLAGERASRVEVYTFDSWCKEYLSVASQIFAMRSDEEVGSLAEEAKRWAHQHHESESRIWGYPTEWWLDEFAMLLEEPIESLDEYVDMKRAGREQALDRSLRPLVWSAYERFTGLLKQHGMLTWEMLRYRAYVRLKDDDTQRYDHVLIDEGQDVPPVVLRIASMLAKTSNLTISVDGAQNIFRPGFSWKAMGIVFKRRRELDKNFRSTQEILAAAEPFRPIEEEEPIRSIAIQKQGPKPRVVVLRTGLEASWIEMDLKRRLKSGALDLGRVAILSYPNKVAWSISAYLSKAGFPVTHAKDREQAMDFGDSSIKVIPTMSSKGLDFGLVYVAPVGRDYDAHPETMRRVFYVALTRALEELVIVTKVVGRSKLLDEFSAGTVEFCEDAAEEPSRRDAPPKPVEKSPHTGPASGKASLFYGIVGSRVYHRTPSCPKIRKALSKPVELGNLEEATRNGYERLCEFCRLNSSRSS